MKNDGWGWAWMGADGSGWAWMGSWTGKGPLMDGRGVGTGEGWVLNVEWGWMRLDGVGWGQMMRMVDGGG